MQMVRTGSAVCVPTATIEEYLDRLEEIIECSPTMPFTGKCVLDRKEVSGLISAMREALQAGGGSASSARSSQISRTEPFQSQPDLGRKAATSFSEGADEPFEEVSEVRELETPKVDDPQLLDAKAEASRIIEEAKLEAQKIRSGADEYAENALASVEQNALGAARAARKGLEVLQRRRSSGN